MTTPEANLFYTILNSVKPGLIRPLAICLFRRGDSILVAEGRDRVKGETFYRPLGGAIEFGEYASDALRREVREEIGIEIRDIKSMSDFRVNALLYPAGLLELIDRLTPTPR